MAAMFQKSFTQQEPISEAAIAHAVQVMRSGRLHRSNVQAAETGAVADLDRAFAGFTGQPYCLAVTSGGQAMQIALRAAGIGPGDRVLTNAFTLAPVPGAIALVGAEAVLVETTEQLRPDLVDLDAIAEASGAKGLLLSNMRGHLPDMAVIVAICARHKLLLIADCAHTMGATWKGRASGTF
ncbi:MAG: DegT/DnrJ/EryC1/StrS aminotransferase family protein, partial [Rhodobacterales bacterium]